MEVIRNWILGLAGAAIFCSLMTELCPKGSIKNVVKTLCGMLMAITLISPLLKLDMPSYSLNAAKYRRQGEEIAASGKESAEQYSRTIIEDDCRAYILDKAELFEALISDAQVRLKWSDEGCWYPLECSIKGEYNSSLAGLIESELGIAKENQKWSMDEGS